MRESFLEHPVLSVPGGVDPKRYSLCLLGPLALGLSVGLQLTMTAFLLLGPSSKAEIMDELTVFGKAELRPEYDLPIYAAGILGTLAAILMMDRWWRKRLAHVPAEHLGVVGPTGAFIQAAAAAGSMVLYLAIVASRFVSTQAGSGERVEPMLGLVLLVPAAMALGWTVLDLSFGWAYPRAGLESVNRWPHRMNHFLLYAVPVFLVLVVGIPPSAWGFIAGQEFVGERFYHLNFFMGPALSFAHGKGFATEIFSQFGIGWPMLCSWLSHFSAMTYANLMWMGNLYGCVYYIALFFVLRSCFPQAIWAALAVVLAIYWQGFSGITPGSVIWQFPSSTMMRHPMDVWFFLALLRHNRSGGNLWAGMAGAAGALGLFFVTETGIYLCLAFLAYLLVLSRWGAGQERAVGKPSWLLPLLAYSLAASATLLPLLLYASRGALFTAAFWRGWLGAPFLYGAWGLSAQLSIFSRFVRSWFAIPVAELPLSSLTLFLAMLAVYLGVIGYAALRVLRREGTRREILLATLAMYGLGMLANLVVRSHPHNLYHPLVPFAVVLTVLAFHGRQGLSGVLRYSSFPYVAAGGLLVLLLSKPDFLGYPSCLRSCFQSPQPAGLSLTPNPDEACGLPPEYGQFVREFRDIASAIRTVAPDGKDVAIFDVNDTLLCYAANVCPWRPCAFIFQMALTEQSVVEVQNDLIQRPPKYVVTRGQNAPKSPSCDFIWGPLYQVVTNRYVLCQTVGPYEIWALPKSGLAQCQAAEALLAKGQVAEAIACYTEILHLEPDLAAALNNLAWIRAAHAEAKFRDGAEAVRLAERACRVTGYKQPILIGTLAAAYAEAGRFDEATAMAEKARTLALAAGQNDVAAKDQQLVELFKGRQPYHEPSPR
jgi:hypothetical protein